MSLTPAERRAQALAEAHHARPAGALPLATLELTHPDLPEPARLVCDEVDLEAVLEDGTPATFLAVAFEIAPPASGANVWPELDIALDGASPVVEPWLEKALRSNAPIRATFREYVRELAAEGPSRVIGGFEIAASEAGDLRVGARAVLSGFDRAFGRVYNSEEHPGLA